MEIFQAIIAWSLANFGLFMFGVSIIFILFSRLHSNAPRYEIMYKWTALFPLGMTAIYAFVMHAFFPVFSAASIGWQNSPFQYEVAMANLAIGVIALLSIRQSYGFKLATVIASACWLWGDATGHLYQIIAFHNFAVGNAGSWFYMDMLIPLLLIICIIRIQKNQRVEN